MPLREALLRELNDDDDAKAVLQAADAALALRDNLHEVLAIVVDCDLGPVAPPMSVALSDRDGEPCRAATEHLSPFEAIRLSVELRRELGHASH